MENHVIEFGRRIDDEKNHNWEVVDIEKYRITKPVVLIFGGLGTFKSYQANGYCKIVKSLLGTFNEDADVLSIKYLNHYTKDEILSNLEEIVDSLFTPLIMENGKRISLLKASKNMRNVTIFAHCYGAQIAKTMGDLIANRMTQLQYSRDEQKQILEQIFLVSYASFVDNNDLPYKFLDITSPEDGEMLGFYGVAAWNSLPNKSKEIDFSYDDLTNIKRIGPVKNGKFNVYTMYKDKERCYVSRDDNGIYLIPTHLHKKDRYDHSMLEIKRNSDWTPHENASMAGDYASKCLACALCHSVATSVLNNEKKGLVSVDLDKMKKELENIVRPLNGEYKKYIDMDPKSK